MESDESLCERLRRGELAAFDALYERYEGRLFGFVRAYLDDTAEAEDVLHEAFMSVLRGRQTELSSFRGWLYQTARNLCLNKLRSRNRGERARQLIEAQPPPEVRSVDERLMDRAAHAALGQAVARLPTALSEVFHLRASGMSYEEMAQVLALPLGTVKSRMHEMVVTLRQEMRPWTAG
jgi:RNA polymerase sigma-70 factor (ECF subfamily)